jgi:hypothetical protein
VKELRPSREAGVQTVALAAPVMHNFPAQSPRRASQLPGPFVAPSSPLGRLLSRRPIAPRHRAQTTAVMTLRMPFCACRAFEDHAPPPSPHAGPGGVSYPDPLRPGHSHLFKLARENLSLNRFCSSTVVRWSSHTDDARLGTNDYGGPLRPLISTLNRERGK